MESLGGTHHQKKLQALEQLRSKEREDSWCCVLEGSNQRQRQSWATQMIFFFLCQTKFSFPSKWSMPYYHYFRLSDILLSPLLKIPTVSHKDLKVCLKLFGLCQGNERTLWWKINPQLYIPSTLYHNQISLFNLILLCPLKQGHPLMVDYW